MADRRIANCKGLAGLDFSLQSANPEMCNKFLAAASGWEPEIQQKGAFPAAIAGKAPKLERAEGQARTRLSSRRAIRRCGSVVGDQ